MKHILVKDLKNALDELTAYMAKKEIVASTINYAIIRNNRILAAAVEDLEKAIPARLKELETSFFKKGEELYEALPKEEQEQIKNTTAQEKNNIIFSMGINTAPEEEKEERTNLYKAYDEFLNEESDVKLFFVKYKDAESIDIKLPIREWSILEHFVKIE